LASGKNLLIEKLGVLSASLAKIRLLQLDRMCGKVETMLTAFAMLAAFGSAAQKFTIAVIRFHSS
jgi:hypothetical protein